MTLEPLHEALGQLGLTVGSGKDIGKDKPAFGWELEPFVAFGSISGNVSSSQGAHAAGETSACALQGYRGYSKVRTHTALEPYSRSIPRSIGPP